MSDEQVRAALERTGCHTIEDGAGVEEVLTAERTATEAEPTLWQRTAKTIGQTQRNRQSCRLRA